MFFTCKERTSHTFYVKSLNFQGWWVWNCSQSQQRTSSASAIRRKSAFSMYRTCTKSTLHTVCVCVYTHTHTHTHNFLTKSGPYLNMEGPLFEVQSTRLFICFLHAKSRIVILCIPRADTSYPIILGSILRFWRMTSLKLKPKPTTGYRVCPLLACTEHAQSPLFVHYAYAHTPLCNFSTKCRPEFSYTLYWKRWTINI